MRPHDTPTIRRGGLRQLDALTTDPGLPLRQGRFQSPLRDERLAAWLGASLGVLFTTCFVTGLSSHLHQHPLPWFPVPSRPVGLYRVTQGIHVAARIASVPVLVAKLWIVWPRCLAFPPFRHLADVVERAGLAALVGGGVFMVFSGVANIAQWYPWHFSFTASHYAVAWITIGASAAAGWALILWGVRGAPHHQIDTRPGELARFFIAGAVIHDLIFAPPILATGFLLTRLAPGRWRAPVQAALLISGCAALFAWPEVRDYARVNHNPTSLPHNDTANLLVVVLAVWVATAILAVARTTRRRRGAG